MMRLTDAAIRFGGTLLNPDGYFTTVSTDSRKTNAGDLFVALRGDHFDAHQFLPDVAEKASGLVVSAVDKALPLPQWVVQDTTTALGQLAQLRRELFVGPVIAITGSSGKTSVKELTAAILRQCGVVHATAGNFNNHIGVPLTLLAMDAEADFAVIEMGASAGGEIDYLCSIAKPDIALINNVQTAHIEGFGSVEAVAAAKGEIYQGLQPQGMAIVNGDQPWVAQWRQSIADRRCLTFSMRDNRADLSLSDLRARANGCYSFQLHIAISGHRTQQQINLSIPGLHAVNNALAAAACATAAGADIRQIAAGLASVQPLAGRLQTVPLQAGGFVIDDSYNANPDSFKAAIDVLAATTGHRVLVMGDMAELGEHSEALHRQVGDYARGAGLDALYAVGPLSAHAAQVFNGLHFKTKDRLVKALQQEIQTAQLEKKQITLLVKGSRSAGMEQLVDSLLTRGKS